MTWLHRQEEKALLVPLTVQVVSLLWVFALCWPHDSSDWSAAGRKRVYKWLWSRACARAVHFLRVAELTWIPAAVRWPCATAWTECPSPGGERCVSSRCCTVARRRQQVKGGTSSFKCQSKVLSAWFNQQVSAVSASSTSTSRGLTSPKDSYESVCKGKNKKWIQKFNSNPVIVNPEKCKCALCRHALIWEGKNQHEASQKVLWFSRVSAEERFSFLSFFFFSQCGWGGGSTLSALHHHFLCKEKSCGFSRGQVRLERILRAV